MVMHNGRKVPVTAPQPGEMGYDESPDGSDSEEEEATEAKYEQFEGESRHSLIVRTSADTWYVLQTLIRKPFARRHCLNKVELLLQ